MHHPGAEESPSIQSIVNLHNRLCKHERDADDKCGPHSQANEHTFSDEESRWSDECLGENVVQTGFGFLSCGLHGKTSFFADSGSTLVQDYIGTDFGEQEEENREQSGVEDDLAYENPTSRQGYKMMSVRVTNHRHVVCWTTRLPNTGPMLRPERSPKMYMDVYKLLVRPAYQISLTIPEVMFASVAEHEPVTIRTTIKVAKFWATACGMMNTINTA